ncbi:MAG: redox-sensing transcriptional repressor Rex [Treponema sp.]|nr:redox-sensing transcriptional repressor Rex [Treponema sp.]
MIPEPAKERLLCLMRLLERHDGPLITSTEAEALSGWSSHTIRKDISYLGGDCGGSPGGYVPASLIAAIQKALGLERRRRLCVVGLGRLGSALLNFSALESGEFELIAGFDTNVNRVEILKSPVPLYPAYKMPELIRRLAVEAALLCVPVGAAQGAAEKLAESGIRGILNFAPLALRLGPDIAVRNVSMIDELRALAIRLP